MTPVVEPLVTLAALAGGIALAWLRLPLAIAPLSAAAALAVAGWLLVEGRDAQAGVAFVVAYQLIMLAVGAAAAGFVLRRYRTEGSR